MDFQTGSGNRVVLVTLLVLACSTLVPCRASAEQFPSKPIKLILPFGVGSPPDLLGRLVAQKLTNQLGQSVTVENRPGAGSTIGTKAAAAAEPDGHTLLQVNSAFAYAQMLYPNPGYDPAKSFAPVAAVASWSLLLVVNPDVPAGTLQELAAYAQRHPGQINIGHTLGSPPQVLAEMLNRSSGAPFNNVPYREVAQLTSDLLGGRIHAFFGAGPGVLALIREGKLKALAYTGVARSLSLPQVPTVIEAGFPQLALDPTDWTGIVTPAGTPGSVIDTLNRAVNDSLHSSDVQASIGKLGAEPKIASPAEFATFIAAEAKKWPLLVRENGLQPN